MFVFAGDYDALHHGKYNTLRHGCQYLSALYSNSKYDSIGFKLKLDKHKSEY